VSAAQPTTETRGAVSTSWIGYVAPIAVFLIMTAGLEAYFPKYYVWLYILKVVLVSATLVAFRTTWRDIRFEPRVLVPAVLVGAVVFVEWILVDKITPRLAILGGRAAFDPFATLHESALRGLFLAFRFFGLVLMVPVMEELFWRSFLLRYFTNENWAALPIGEFSRTAFAMVAVAFGLAHPEWLAAIFCAVAYGLLLRQTRSLLACVVAHATTNLALGIYVLLTRQWHFW